VARSLATFKGWGEAGKVGPQVNMTSGRADAYYDDKINNGTTSSRCIS